jgi:copper chaperone CopZ
MQSMTLEIDGMHCDGCARTIDHVLRRQPGVWEAEVSLDEGSARVLFDPEQVSVDQIAEAVRKAGYRAASTRA